jgi:hypothetical protein
MYDVFTIVKLSREFAGDDLLTRALDGTPQTVDTVSELYAFVVRYFGRDSESDTSKRFWACCAYYLASQGWTKDQLSKLRRPFPVYGEPGFLSIFDEMAAEGHDIPANLLSGGGKDVRS